MDEFNINLSSSNSVQKKKDKKEKEFEFNEEVSLFTPPPLSGEGEGFDGIEIAGADVKPPEPGKIFEIPVKGKESEFVSSLNSEDKELLIRAMDFVLNSAEKELKNAKKKNGAVSGGWNLFKNLTGMEFGSDNIQDRINKLKIQVNDVKEGKLSLTSLYKEVTGNELNEKEIANILNSRDFSNAKSLQDVQGFKEGQKLSGETIPAISSALASFGINAATGGTAGLIQLFSAAFLGYIIPSASEHAFDDDGYTKEEIKSDLAKGTADSALNALGIKAFNTAKPILGAQIMGTGNAVSNQAIDQLSKDGKLDIGALTETAAAAGIAALAAMYTASNVSNVIRPLLTKGNEMLPNILGRLASSSASGAAAGTAGASAAGSAKYIIDKLNNGEEIKLDELINAASSNIPNGAIMGAGLGAAFETIQIAGGLRAPKGAVRYEDVKTENGIKVRNYLDKDGNILASDMKAKDVLKFMREKAPDAPDIFKEGSETTLTEYNDVQKFDARTLRMTYKTAVMPDGTKITVKMPELCSWSDKSMPAGKPSITIDKTGVNNGAPEKTIDTEFNDITETAPKLENGNTNTPSPLEGEGVISVNPFEPPASINTAEPSINISETAAAAAINASGAVNEPLTHNPSPAGGEGNISSLNQTSSIVSGAASSINSVNTAAEKIRKFNLKFFGSGETDSIHNTNYEELSELIQDDEFAGVKKNSPEFKQALDILDKGLMEDAEDALEAAIASKGDKKTAEKIIKLYEKTDGAMRITDIANLMEQGLSNKDISNIGLELEENPKGKGIDILYDMVQDKTAASVMKIFNAEDDITLEDAFNTAKKLNFDKNKIDEALNLTEEADSWTFGITEAADLAASGKEYSIEEIMDAADLIENNPSASMQKFSDVFETIKQYGMEKTKNALDIMHKEKLSQENIPISDIAQLEPEKLQEILDFKNQSNIPFKEAQRYKYFEENPRKTGRDEIYPKNLTNEELKIKYQDGSSWQTKVNDMYNQIRRSGNYAVDYGKDNFSGNFGDLYRVIHNNDGIHVFEDGGWMYHDVSLPGKMPEERISLNVKGDADLIIKLDDLMKQTNGAFVYKTFAEPAKWTLREDPVTMYFKDEIPDELLDKIAEITKPYARGNINGAENTDTPWIMKETYTHGSVIDELLARAKNLDKGLYETLKKDAGADKNLSTGQYKAYMQIMDEYERFKSLSENISLQNPQSSPQINAGIQQHAALLFKEAGQHINEAEKQIKDLFEGLKTSETITSRPKDEAGIIKKLAKGGILDTSSFEDCKDVMRDLYGTRLQIKSLATDEAAEIIENQLKGTGLSSSDFISFVQESSMLPPDKIQALEEIKNNVINALKEAQTQDTVNKIIKIIQDENSDIEITELNNYGNEISSYFTPRQVQQIAEAYDKRYGANLIIVSKADDNGYGVEVGFYDVKRYPVIEKGAVKKSGYSSAHFNTVHKFKDGSTGFGELQVRGTSVNQLSDIEHILYDMSEGKFDETLEKYKKYIGIYKIVQKIGLEKFNNYRNAYFSKAYEAERHNELGIPVKKPDINSYLDYLPPEERRLLSIEGLIEIHSRE